MKQSVSGAKQPNRVFVGNINIPITEGELKTMVEPFGAVRDIQLATDPNTGRFKGFAFVELSDDEAIARVIEGLNGKMLGGRCLKVRLGF
jgi:RNA recognition motif-containing protein